MQTAQQNIVILTGAGISAESGIQTFRASDGLWHEHHVNDVATPEGFARDPELVHRFYNARRRQLFSGDIHPNAAHYALDILEQKKGDNVLVVTQNIDNLHEEAGSENLIHMHGELSKVHCQNTGKVFDCFDDLSTQSVCECCQTSGNLRPHIVWFGEMPLEMDRINAALANCDVFISIGTSGLVYPAAGFVGAAKHVGAKTIELNLEASQNSSLFDLSINGLASEVVPEYISENLL